MSVPGQINMNPLSYSFFKALRLAGMAGLLIMAGLAWAAPTVSFTSPANGAVLAPGNVTLTASAADAEGSIAKVEFFNSSNTLIGTATTPPYSVTLNNLPSGQYLIQAKATNNLGASTYAMPAANFVINALPTVSFTSPAKGAVLAPGNVTLTASAADADGSINRVEFYNFMDGQLLGTATTSPYSVTWRNAPAGSHTLAAVAFDNHGALWVSLTNFVVAAPAQAAVYYIQPDHLGTPRAVVDETNKIVWRNLPTSEAFGNSPPEEDPDADGTRFELNLRFPGQYYDKESGLAQNWHRDYDPSIGRYPQSDPIGLAGGINTYAYADNAPTMYSDPTGLAPTIRIPGIPLPIPLLGGGSSGTSSSGGTGNPDLDAGMGSGGSTSGSSSSSSSSSSAQQEQCKQPCPPCKLADGKVVAIGTIGYRWDKLPPNVVQHGIAGDHLNLYEVNQNPNNCKCFWKRGPTVRPPPLPGWIPIQPLM